MSGGSGRDVVARRTNTIVMSYLDDAEGDAVPCAPSIAALVDRLAARLALTLMLLSRAASPGAGLRRSM